VNRVRNVGLPVGDRAFLGGEGLEDAAQPRKHGEAGVLKFLDLELFEVTGFGEAKRVKAATRGDVTLGEFRERVFEDTGTVSFGGADEEDFDGEHRPEGRVARAFRSKRGDGARELVRDGGTVIRSAEGTRGEPRNTSTVFSSPRAGDAEHRPAAVDDFAFGVLLVTERNDRGFTTARVGAEFRVQVRRRDGAELGSLRRGERDTKKVVKISSVSSFSSALYACSQSGLAGFSQSNDGCSISKSTGAVRAAVDAFHERSRAIRSASRCVRVVPHRTASFDRVRAILKVTRERINQHIGKIRSVALPQSRLAISSASHFRVP